MRWLPLRMYKILCISRAPDCIIRANIFWLDMDWNRGRGQWKKVYLFINDSILSASWNTYRDSNFQLCIFSYLRHSNTIYIFFSENKQCEKKNSEKKGRSLCLKSWNCFSSCMRFCKCLSLEFTKHYFFCHSSANRLSSSFISFHEKTEQKNHYKFDHYLLGLWSISNHQ